MKKLYNKVRNDRWEAGEICMAVISKFGTGGGNVPIVLESNEMKTITTSHNYMHTVGITDGIASGLAATDYKDPPTVTVIGGGGWNSE